MDRRRLIKSAGAATLLNFFAPKNIFSATAENFQTPRRVLRIAHLTDIHLQKDKAAPEGLAKCLHHLQNLNPQPDIIFNGGDTIDDALFNTKLNVKKQWDLFHAVVRNECCLNIEHCIGNHDVWGLITEKKDPLYGKKFALEQMELENTYRSFDRAGWHFIILDSTHERKTGIWYTAKLGDKQVEWLQQDLENTPADKPVMIISHIPILSASVFFDKTKVHNGNINMAASLMHTDYKKIINLFSEHKNVKLCISGHIHLADHVQYNGVSYYCNGAVSGDWWNAPYYHETKAGYAVIDLFDDGSFSNQYLDYSK
ncbi:MAG: metallophosphoesterase [Fimbriimonadaceae bacterium]|nr:metallophosphoesterase [Chitinophagales bacterium]